MKNTLCIAILFFCCIIVEARIPRHILTYYPAHVHQGDTVQVTYDYRNPTAAFQMNSGALLLVYIYNEYPLDQNDYLHPILKMTPMIRHDSTWTASFVVNVPDAKFFMMRIESSTEEDKNNGYFWTGLIYGKNDVPVENAYAFLAANERGLAADSTYHMRPDMEAAFNDIDKEIQLYPKNFMAWDLKFRLLKDKNIGLSTEYFGTIDSAIKATDPEITEITASRIDHWYTVTGKRDKALSLEDNWIKEQPHSNFAFLIEFHRAQSIRDPLSRDEALLNLFHSTAEDSGYAFRAGRLWVVNYYMQSGKFASAESLMAVFRHPEPIDYNSIVNAYFSFVDPADTSKHIHQVSHLIDLERTALDSESRHPSYMKDLSLREDEKMRRENSLLAQFHYTLARLYQRLPDQQDSVFRNIAEAMQLSHSQDPGIVSMMLHMMIARANEDQNIGRMFPMVVMGAEGNDSLWQLVKQAFVEFKNPPVSFDQMQEMGKRMMQKKREAAFCKYQYRALAPAFTLPTLTNGIIDSLPKGKVTVLDFWGTWCPPCTTTLPKLDSVYQEYKTNDSVQFYAIDCLEKTSSFSELTSTVKDFIKNTGVAMPVLLDTAGAAVKAYDVYFYPTRVVIDKKGVIRAWDVGYPEENISDIVKFEIDELLDNACNQSMQ